jgi:hypothetical protein
MGAPLMGAHPMRAPPMGAPLMRAPPMEVKAGPIHHVIFHVEIMYIVVVGMFIKV